MLIKGIAMNTNRNFQLVTISKQFVKNELDFIANTERNLIIQL
jgi:hypothetical protein